MREGAKFNGRERTTRRGSSREESVEEVEGATQGGRGGQPNTTYLLDLSRGIFYETHDVGRMVKTKQGRSQETM